MSTLRQDPLTGRWVVFAGGREARPNEYPLLRRAGAAGGRCPFCPGHEADTTPEVLATGRPAGSPANGPGWRLRAFPNLYPAVGAGAGEEPAADIPEPLAGLFPACAGRGGRHEVIVCSPDHAASLATLGPADLGELLRAVRERVASFRAEPDVRFVAPFCNHGPEAGATLAHPHLQIIGAPRVPRLAVDKALRLRDWRRRRGTCLLCDLVAAERALGSRLVASDAHWTALAPWASRFPWEVLLAPVRHGPCALPEDGPSQASLAAMLAGVLGALRRAHGDLSFNLVFHLAPQVGRDGSLADADLDGLDPGPNTLWHGHVEVLPRLSRLAGFEAGTGYAINAAWPEEVAARLRDLGAGGEGCA